MIIIITIIIKKRLKKGCFYTKELKCLGSIICVPLVAKGVDEHVIRFCERAISIKCMVSCNKFSNGICNHGRILPSLSIVLRYQMSSGFKSL